MSTTLQTLKNAYKVTCDEKRTPLRTLNAYTERLRGAQCDLEGRVTELKAVPNPIPQECDASIAALAAASEVISVQIAATDQTKKGIQELLDRDPEYVAADYGYSVTGKLAGVLDRVERRVPVAWIPGRVHDDADVLDFITSTNEHACTAALKRKLDPLVVKRIKGLKPKPCTVFIKYRSRCRLSANAPDWYQRFSTQAETKGGTHGDCTLLGYSQADVLDMDLIEQHKHHATVVKLHGDQCFDELLIKIDGQVFWPGAHGK